MTTAREQAREATSFVNLGNVLEVDVRLLADATSDVWEPLLRAQLKHWEALFPDKDVPIWIRAHAREQITLLKEVLDGNS